MFMIISRNHYPVLPIAVFTLLAWLGGFIHNRIELPQLSLLSWENAMPIVVWALLFWAWWQLPFKRVTMSILLGWAVLNLVGGGILSVIPFSFLLFYPEQTLRHYLTHIVYGAAQLPLIIAAIQQLRVARLKASVSGADT
jgi:hypothetical protein